MELSSFLSIAALLSEKELWHSGDPGDSSVGHLLCDTWCKWSGNNSFFFFFFKDCGSTFVEFADWWLLRGVAGWRGGASLVVIKGMPGGEVGADRQVLLAALANDPGLTVKTLLQEAQAGNIKVNRHLWVRELLVKMDPSVRRFLQLSDQDTLKTKVHLIHPISP